MTTADDIIDELQTGEYEYHSSLEDYLEYGEIYESRVFKNLAEACQTNTLDRYPDRGGSFCQFLWDYGPYAALLRAHPKNQAILEEMGYSTDDEEFNKDTILEQIFESEAS